MNKVSKASVLAGAVMFGGLMVSGAANAGVSVGVNIGVPAPVYVAPEPVYAPPPPPPAYYPAAPARQVTYYRAGYEPWSRGWYQYCSDRYRSFNPNTGTYRGYDGRDHFCSAN